MNQSKKLRLFLDSNILTGGLMARWGLDKAILSLCAAHACQMVLAEIVREEVERNLLKKALASNLDPEAADQLLSDYDRLISLAKPEVVPLPDRAIVLSSRRLIRHAADVPVLVSAINAKPDWLITHNTNHFTAEVAQRTGLRIATPFEFFREIVQSFSQGRESE